MWLWRRVVRTRKSCTCYGSDTSGGLGLDNIRHGQDQEVLAAGHHAAAHATRAKPNAPALPEPAKRKSRRVIARGTRAKPKPPRKAKRKGRSGR